MRALTIIDLFAGPGGWSMGLRQLGRQDMGIEIDATACATRRAAGHLTVRADVSTFPLDHLRGRVEGLILSPPCPDFSSAGKRAGIAGKSGGLIFEVPRWVETLRPMWVACEQVPEALPYWRMFAKQFRVLGYSTWCGILVAADFGVPQERYRAILMAHRGKIVHPPTPTHAEHPEDGLFGPALLPWVSMAEGLGWDADYRRWRGAGMTERHGPRPDALADAPAPTITGRARTDMLVVKGTTVQHPTERPADRPAPALSFGHNAAGWGWVQRERSGDRTEEGFATDQPSQTLTSKARSWSIKTNQRVTGTNEYTRREVERASPTLTGNTRLWQWEQPATTVCGDPRITARCHHEDGSQGAGAKTTDRVRDGDYAGTEPVRLRIEEALILQGFPPSYPLQGSRTKQFAQCGDAIPPPMARAILSMLVEP